jgi:hypothetical protein
MKASWLTVNLEGWANSLSCLERHRVVNELVQNAMDTDTPKIVVTIELPKRGRFTVQVEDFSPEGFRDMRAAYEMHLDTEKRDDPTKAGQFTTGEKKFLALCESASIESTKGTLVFMKKGKEEDRQFFPKRKRACGTLVRGVMLVRDEKDWENIVSGMEMLIPRHGQQIIFNGAEIQPRTPVLTFAETLQTVKATSKLDRRMRPEMRETSVLLYEPMSNEKPTLYELGLPVVEIECRWHINIAQRVPLNSDRDNVQPKFLSGLLARVMNHAHAFLKGEDLQKPWVIEATSHPDINQAAYKDTMDKVYGEKKVVVDPNDPESAKRAMSEGYTPIYGRTLTSGQHDNNRKFGLIPASSSVFPTPTAYGVGGEPAEILSEDELTDGMKMVRSYMVKIGSRLIGQDVVVNIIKKGSHGFGACYIEGGRIDLFLNNLGRRWFEEGITEDVDALLIHELGHHYCSDHYDKEYFRALCRLGAQMKRISLEQPGLFAW